MEALKILLSGDIYQSLTVGEAINRYAPPSENDTFNYQKTVSQSTGLDLSTRMDLLNDFQMTFVINVIRTDEGWIAGEVIYYINSIKP